MSTKQRYTEQHASFRAIAGRVDDLDAAADAIADAMFESKEFTPEVVRDGIALVGDWEDTYEQGGDYRRTVSFWERKYRATWWEYL